MTAKFTQFAYFLVFEVGELGVGVWR